MRQGIVAVPGASNEFGGFPSLRHYLRVAEDTENLVLVYLRRIDAKVDVVQRDLTEVKQRLSAVEIGLASVRRDISLLAETDARLQVSMDRIREDVDRIQRRLDLTDQPAA